MQFISISHLLDKIFYIDRDGICFRNKIEFIVSSEIMVILKIFKEISLNYSFPESIFLFSVHD